MTSMQFDHLHGNVTKAENKKVSLQENKDPAPSSMIKSSCPMPSTTWFAPCIARDLRNSHHTHARTGKNQPCFPVFGCCQKRLGPGWVSSKVPAENLQPLLCGAQPGTHLPAPCWSCMVQEVGRGINCFSPFRFSMPPSHLGAQVTRNQ